jgi:hypothetical protein
VKKAMGFYPRPDVDGAGTQVVSQAGALRVGSAVVDPDPGLGAAEPDRDVRGHAWVTLEHGDPVRVGPGTW